MPYELWNALSKRVVTGPDDERLKDPAFLNGYELASQWEAASRLLQYRARREARKARQMLLYVQAIDRCTDGGPCRELITERLCRLLIIVRLAIEQECYLFSRACVFASPKK